MLALDILFHHSLEHTAPGRWRAGAHRRRVLTLGPCRVCQAPQHLTKKVIVNIKAHSSLCGQLRCCGQSRFHGDRSLATAYVGTSLLPTDAQQYHPNKMNETTRTGRRRHDQAGVQPQSWSGWCTATVTTQAPLGGKQQPLHFSAIESVTLLSKQHLHAQSSVWRLVDLVTAAIRAVPVDPSHRGCPLL